MCVRSLVRSFIHSFIHSLSYSMTVNYLKILLDKFMVLIISMSSGIIRQCLIILSADRQQTRQWYSVSICGVSQENVQSYRIKTV